MNKIHKMSRKIFYNNMKCSYKKDCFSFDMYFTSCTLPYWQQEIEIREKVYSNYIAMHCICNLAFAVKIIQIFRQYVPV